LVTIGGNGGGGGVKVGVHAITIQECDCDRRIVMNRSNGIGRRISFVIISIPTSAIVRII